MIKLSQRDPKWSSKRLGETAFTVGKYGCTITGLSMLSDYYGKFHDPGYLAEHLNFTGSGLIIWASMGTELPFKLVKRLYKRDDKEIEFSIKNPETSVLLQVQGNHWVVAIKRVPLTKTYVIADPWTGAVTTTLRYKNQITGSAHFFGKRK